MASLSPSRWNKGSQDTGEVSASACGGTNVHYPVTSQDSTVRNDLRHPTCAGTGTTSGASYAPEYHSVPPPLPHPTPFLAPPSHHQVRASYNLAPNLPPYPSAQHHASSHTQQPPLAPHLQSFLQQPNMSIPTPTSPAMQDGGMAQPPAPITKNAVMLLNEASQKLKLGTPIYNFLTMPAATTQTVSLEICHHTFIGAGATRAAAKNVAAQKALAQLQDLRRSAPVLSKSEGPQPVSREKDPVSALNELCQKQALTTLYHFTSLASGQWHGPSHTARLGIAGRFFVASAPRKDVAKKLAARAALDYLQGPVGVAAAKDTFPPSTPTTGAAVTAHEIAALAQALPAATQGQSVQDSTPSGATQEQGPQYPSPSPAAALVNVLAAMSSGAAGPIKREYASVAGTDQDPVSLLNKHATLQGKALGISIQALLSGFIAACVVNGQTFSAEGGSKGEAKKSVADKVLLHLEEQQPGTLESLRIKGSKKRARKHEGGAMAAKENGVKATEEESGPTVKKPKLQGPREQRQWVEKGKGDGKAFAYSLAAVVSSRYRNLARASNTQQRQRKVLAAIILERPSPSGKALLSVVAIGTGRHMAPRPSADDTLLRDCRPEILACRAFRRFLCARLERELRGNPLGGCPTEDGKPAVAGAVKVEEGKGHSGREEAGVATAAGSDAGPNPLLNPKVEAGADDALQERPSSKGMERVRSDGQPTGGGVMTAVKVEPLENNPGVSSDQEKLGAVASEAASARAPEVGAEIEVTGGVANDAEECTVDAVGEEALFCKGEEEGRCQWRLRDDVKVHLWVTLPQGCDTLESETERQSRTDKIRRWTAVGVQGAVLSHLLSPVYLSIITVNCAAGLYREAADLPAAAELSQPPFAVHQPTVVRAGNMLKWAFRVEPGAGMTEDAENWALGDEELETMKTADGRPEGGESRLSRRQIFEQFRRLQDASKGAASAKGGCEAQAVPSFPTWEVAKRAAAMYQKAKEALARFLIQQELAEEGPSSDDKDTAPKSAKLESVTADAVPQTGVNRIETGCE